ncbi:hypothetical protein IFM89_036965 [Coptis chinensis]|uniref:DUF7806 domain-containing protein n=1 Tax=Coptis chinensis TaxID=261450 RepID=A0A835LPR4_9MAGN|nr:hypothetical protein IFM89_036965 [Coptis chinensis]
MEALYSKLYDKYNKLKSKKISEIEEIGHDQEVKFVNYATASDELIEHLKSENERLEAQLNELHSEVDLMRSSRDEYRKLLNDECQKTKELFKEVERLQNLQQQEINSILTEGNSNSVRTRKQKNGDMQLGSFGATQVVLEDTSAGYGRKKLRLQHPVPQSDDANDSTRMRVSSGGCISTDIMLQNLLESLVGMKFGFVDEEKGLCLSAVHQSSGYSFSITWVSKAAEQEVELLYQVLSLGTIGGVAKEWMKEEIMFNLSMWPLFVKRVSQVIGM